MGIRAHGITFIHKTLDTTFYNLHGTCMIEMGNMYIRKDAIEWIQNNKFDLEGFTKLDMGIISKEYFTALGCKHTSIDLNMKDGAIPIDLRKSIKDNDIHNLINTADIILDSGTSEHISYQYMNWKNLYDITKVGGIFLHILPKVGYWKNHCEYKYDIDFFEQLAKANDYEIIEISNSYADKDICAAFRKTNNKGFMSEDEFNKLPIHICKPEGKSMLNDRALYPWGYTLSSSFDKTSEQYKLFTKQDELEKIGISKKDPSINYGVDQTMFNDDK
tara:strand:+ start:274 stop:1098 length:825 start_codon:yes stop_codon:yes gene_type:complete